MQLSILLWMRAGRSTRALLLRLTLFHEIYVQSMYNLAKTAQDYLCHTQLAGVCYLVAQSTRPIKHGRPLDLRPAIECIQQCPAPVIVIMLSMVSGAIDENDDMGVLGLDIASV